MSCDEWREDVSAWVDDELAPRRRIEVDAHLKSCRDCRRLVREFRDLTELARRAPAPRTKPEVTDAAMALVQAREARKRWSWWSGPGMFWPQFSLGISGLAVVGFLAFIATRDSVNGFRLFDHAADSQKLAATHIPPDTGSARAPQGAVAVMTAVPPPPAPGAPPIFGNLIVDNSSAGTERLAALARSLGGHIDTVATPAQSTVYVSIPSSVRTVFQARLPEIGNWQHSPFATESAESVIGIRIIQQP